MLFIRERILLCTILWKKGASLHFRGGWRDTGNSYSASKLQSSENDTLMGSNNLNLLARYLHQLLPGHTVCFANLSQPLLQVLDSHYKFF